MTLVTGSTTGTTATETGSTALSKLTADYDLFLKLLTTQMQNQDPLDPMDSSEYTQQLVQYSQVEQSIEQNKTLTSILSNLNMASLTQSSSMIGQKVELDSDVAGLSASTPAQWNWIAAGSVTSVTATILDANGNEVDKVDMQVSGTSGTFAWDGKTSTGKTLADGVYRATLTGTNSAGTSIAMQASASGTVQNVQMLNGAAVVSINDAQYPTSLITRIEK
ncbi:flagellar hook assembly protein FlgD [Sphingomonas sp. RS6]